MKFIYFPFTYISRSSYKTLSSFFRKITVFQADLSALPPVMKPLAESGFLEIATPVRGNEEKLHQRITAFKTWGEGMDDKSRASFKADLEETPFFTETASSRIRTDLKEMLVSDKANAVETPRKKITEEDRLLWAGMILKLAGEWDMKSDEIQADLANYREMEKRLFENVRGGSWEEDPIAVNPFPDDAGVSDPSIEDKLKERLIAWSMFLSYYKEETGVFVTDKKEVVDYLREFSGLEEMAFQVGPVPEGPDTFGESESFYSDLETSLIQLARGEVDALGDFAIPFRPDIDGQKKKMVLDIYLGRRLAPSLFFKKMGVCSAEMNEASRVRESVNTVVCLIRRND